LDNIYVNEPEETGGFIGAKLMHLLVYII